MNRIVWMLAAATGATQAPVVSAAQLQLTTGVEYSNGDYGETTSTEALLVPFSARWSLGNLSLRASVPWLTVRGPANIAPVFDDDGGNRSSNTGSGSSGGSSDDDEDDDDLDDDDDDDDFDDDRDVRGFGDMTLSATWTFQDIGGTRLYADLTGRVRLPTGDEAAGLGRGATDYTAVTEIGWDGRRGGVFVIAGRRFLESVGTTRREDGWIAGAGYWRNIGRNSLFGMQGNWRQSAAPNGTDPRSIDAFLMRRLGGGWRIEVHGTAGLSDASPDYAAGFQVSWRVGTR